MGRSGSLSPRSVADMTVAPRMNLHDRRAVFLLSVAMTMICMVYVTIGGMRFGHFRFSRDRNHGMAHGASPSVMRRAVKSASAQQKTVKSARTFETVSSRRSNTGQGNDQHLNVSAKEPVRPSYRQYSGRVTLESADYRKDYLRVESIYMDVKKSSQGNITYHALSKDDPYRTRLASIQQECKLHPDGKYSSVVDLKRLMYDDRHKVIMCVIPKTACTTWKTLMYYLMGRSTLDDAFKIPKDKLVLNFGNIQTMARLKPEEILKRLNTYTKFTVVRDPFLRLVSAYRNKFDPTPGRGQNQKMLMKYTVISREIARLAIANHGLELPSFKGKSRQQLLGWIASSPQFRRFNATTKKIVLDIVSRGCARNITFEEFIRYGVLKPSEELTRKLDIHWRPQHMICNPCAIDYDYVIRFENLEPESTRLLSYIQRNDYERTRISFPGGWMPAVDNSAAKEEFQKLPLDVRKKLEQIFQRDFAYFGYSKTTL